MQWEARLEPLLGMGATIGSATGAATGAAAGLSVLYG